MPSVDRAGDDDDMVESGSHHMVERPPKHGIAVEHRQQLVGRDRKPRAAAGSEQHGGGQVIGAAYGLRAMHQIRGPTSHMSAPFLTEILMTKV